MTTVQVLPLSCCQQNLSDLLPSAETLFTNCIRTKDFFHTASERTRGFIHRVEGRVFARIFELVSQ